MTHDSNQWIIDSSVLPTPNLGCPNPNPFSVYILIDDMYHSTVCPTRAIPPPRLSSNSRISGSRRLRHENRLENQSSHEKRNSRLSYLYRGPDW